MLKYGRKCQRIMPAGIIKHADYDILYRQIEQCSTRIECLRKDYEEALDSLETAMQVLIKKTRKKEWSVPKARKDMIIQWFQLFLHVSDLRIEIRRGEVRHKTTRDLKQFSCQHKTGRSEASHSGLSIDDVNVLYQKLDRSLKDHRVRTRLECLFLQIDLLDRDQIGTLDSRLRECLSTFESCIGKYHKIEIIRNDPHDKLIVFADRNGASTDEYSVYRTCFDPSSCLCPASDFEPWKDFQFTIVEVSPDRTNEDGQLNGGRCYNATEAPLNVGLNELKRRYGFEILENTAECYQMCRATAHVETKRVGIDPLLSANHPDQALRYFRSRVQSSKSPECEHFQFILSNMQDNSLHIHLGGYYLKSMAETIDIFLDTVEHFDIRITGIDVSNTILDNASTRSICRMCKMRASRHHSLTLKMRGLTLDSFDNLLCLLDAISMASSGQWLKIHQLDLSYNNFIFSNRMSSLNWLQQLPRQFPALEELILVSCFPAPLWAIQHQNEEEVFVALLTCRQFPRLVKIDYSCNWVSSAILHIFFTLCELRQLTLDNLKFGSSSLTSEEILQRHEFASDRQSVPDMASWIL